MKREKKTQISDFRYATGAARIGWPAVGEPMRPDDVMKVVEFLVPVAPGRSGRLPPQAGRGAACDRRNDGHSEADVNDIKTAIQEDQLPTERALLAMVNGHSKRNGRGASVNTRTHAGGV